MKAGALAVLLLWTMSSHARADLTVEVRGLSNVMMMKVVNMRMRGEVRDDRSRMMRWVDDPSEPGMVPDSTYEIVREDKRLRWVLHPGTKTYEQYPWPDTVPPYPMPAVPPESLYKGMPDSVAERLRAMADQFTEVRRTGERDTLNGFLVEHVVIETRPRKAPRLPQGLQLGSINDVWLADVPNWKEIRRLLEIHSKHLSLSHPTYGMPVKSPGLMPEFADQLDRMPIRAIVRMKMMDSTGIAEARRVKASAHADSSTGDMLEKVFDLDTGSMLVADIQVTELRLGRVEDSVFELPAGYKRAEWQLDKEQEDSKPPPGPRKKVR